MNYLMDNAMRQVQLTSINVPHMAIAIARDTFCWGQLYLESLLKLWKTYYPNEQVETYCSEKTSNVKDEIMRKLKSSELSLVNIVAMLLKRFN